MNAIVFAAEIVVFVGLMIFVALYLVTSLLIRLMVKIKKRFAIDVTRKERER